jgi:RNA polymerase sigma factor (sigma-70 family)
LKSSKKHSDQTLLKGLLEGREEIVLELYRKSFGTVRHFILSNHGAEEDVKDLFQDAIMVIFQKARRNELQLSCSLNTYIYSVCRNLWLKELSLRGRTVHHYENAEEITDEDSDIELWQHYNERITFYRKIFEELSEDCKRILKLFISGESIRNITKIMGYSSEQYTKNRRYRCKLSLIQRIRATSIYNELKNEIDEDNRKVPGWYAKR